MKSVVLGCLLTFNLHSQTPSEYIQKYLPKLTHLSTKYDICMIPVVELAAKLSENGINRFAKINNHFQLKCLSKKCHRGHCTNFKGDTHKDFYLIFKNPIDSYDAYCKLNRYKLSKLCH